MWKQTVYTKVWFCEGVAPPFSDNLLEKTATKRLSYPSLYPVHGKCESLL